jgi:hypothetical protein
MIFARDILLKNFPGVLTTAQIRQVANASLSDSSGNQRLSCGVNFGSFTHTLGATSTFNVPLPAGYTNASRLFVIIRVQNAGVMKVSVVSPDHSNSAVLIGKASSANDAVHSFCNKVTSMALYNPMGAAVKFSIFMLEIPDLTDEDSFLRGA